MGRFPSLAWLPAAAVLSAAASVPAAPEELPGNRSPYEVLGHTYTVLPSNKDYVQVGIASWYGSKFHGRMTANGETYDMHQFTAAHKSLRLPAWVKVTNLENGRRVFVWVNDRGPFHHARLIDLSYAAAHELGFAEKGTAAVVVESMDTSFNAGPLTTGPGSYYLQLGAFAQRARAETVRNQVLGLMEQGLMTQPLQVKVFASDHQQGILNKVWLGPIDGETAGKTLTEILYAAGLGTPMRINVD